MNLRHPLSVCAIILSAGVFPALGQNSDPLPATPTTPPAEPSEPAEPMDEKPGTRDVVIADPAARARAALVGGIQTSKWLRYTITIEGPGSALYTADVTLERADAGGWKIAVKGEMRASKSVAEGKGKTIVAAFDGVVARSLRETDKQVGELSDPANLDELAAFFAKERAASAIPWELLADKPLSAANSTLAHEGEEEVGGVMCDILRYFRKADKADQDAGDTGHTRYFIGQKDNLVRKIERFPGAVKPDAKPAPKPVRSALFSSVEFDESPRGGEFTINAPKGFTVKPEAKRTVPKPIDKAKEDAKKPPKDNGLLAVGAVAPEWSLKDDQGNDAKLSALKGKIVVMDFWATWCGPCKAAMPSIQKIHKKYESRGVVVLGMHTDSKTDKDAPKIMKNLGCDYTLLTGAGSVSASYQVSGIPALYIIGTDGKVAWTHVGNSPKLEADMSAALDALLAGAK